jgi:small neutral amino acid transporter SnatA (MarC family)
MVRLGVEVVVELAGGIVLLLVGKDLPAHPLNNKSEERMANRTSHLKTMFRFACPSCVGPVKR